MVDLLAIVKRSVFESDAKKDGESPDQTGFTFGWKEWLPTRQSIVSRIEGGGRVWAVTVRPGDRLWLIAVYENPKVTYDDEDEEYFFETIQGNRVKVMDITDLIPRIKFENGSKITRKRGRLAQGLQTIRALNTASVKLLEERSGLMGTSDSGDARGSKQSAEKDNGKDPIGIEAERYLTEVTRRRRDRSLTTQRLKLDAQTCQHCGFSPTIAGLSNSSAVVDVHHIFPLKDANEKAATRLEDLITLCPTCHRVAHALAAEHKQQRLDLEMLRRLYPRPRKSRARSAPHAAVA